MSGELSVACSYTTGDLVLTREDLAIRKDGLVFGRVDTDVDGKLPKDWLVGSDDLPSKTFCTFIKQAQEDPAYAVVRRDLMGRVLVIRISMLELANSFDTTVDIEPGTVDEGEGMKCDLT